MIAADEQRHHQLLSDLAEPLRSRVTETKDDSVIAKAEPLSPERREALLETTRRLLAIEEEDSGELRKLRRRLHQAPDQSIWPLLVEIMELDTEKHIRILRAVERHFTRNTWSR